MDCAAIMPHWLGGEKHIAQSLGHEKSPNDCNHLPLPYVQSLDIIEFLGVSISPVVT